jgi:hypothetical protein
MILIISLSLSAFPLYYTRIAPTAIMAMGAAPFLHSKHLSFVILQLMEYTIYDYLIALDSK